MRTTLRLPARALRGTHRLAITATDAAGNRSTLRLTLRRGVVTRVSR